MGGCDGCPGHRVAPALLATVQPPSRPAAQLPILPAAHLALLALLACSTTLAALLGLGTSASAALLLLLLLLRLLLGSGATNAGFSRPAAWR